MIPVRRWPLAAALLLALSVPSWARAARRALGLLGVYGAALGALSRQWLPACAVPVLAAAGVWALCGAERVSRDVRLRLRELRDLLAAERDGAP